MKNRVAAVLIFIMAVAVALTGCGGEKTAAIEKTSDLQGKVIGLITPSDSKEAVEAMISQALGCEPGEFLYYNRYSDAIAAIISGKADAVFTPKFVADYYVKKNDQLNAITVTPDSKVDVSMAVRSEDQELKAALDSAITVLRENGTLKALEDKWITNLPTDKEPASEEVPKITDAKTIYVGVSGDMVPLDYIAADGRPAGYNVALLTEIGKLTNINFEFVSVENQARFMALSSKKIDVIFIVAGGKDATYQTEEHAGWITTEPYYTTVGRSILVRK